MNPQIKKLIKKFIPDFLLAIYHYCLVLTAAFLYRFPSRKIRVIGITGTSGKSTAVELSSKIFEEAGYKVASLSSIRFKIGEKEWPNRLKMTMPGRWKVQRFLRRAVRAGCDYAVLEVTSEGIKQYRHKFIRFEAAVLTNLSPEHIEAHGSFEKYRQTKAELFKATSQTHIINLDDENAGHFWQIPAEEKIGYGIKISNFQFLISNKFSISNFQTIFAEDVQQATGAINFSLNKVEFNLNLFGRFNIYNALAAIGAALSQEVSLEICQKALKKIKGIPGRMEIVIKEPFRVIVDYAHTPAELKQVYEALRNSKSQIPIPNQIPNPDDQKPKLICVLGACGGGRDKWKRPVLGEIAARYCDEIIITNEDPYDEDPMKIIERVASGAEKIRLNQSNQHKSAVHKILDRREAIREALKLARSGDLVVITGKGCEPWMCVAGGKKIPWDDRKIVKEEYEKIRG